MSMTEREPVSRDVNLDCPGCVERDLEIERLLELNRKLNSNKLSLKTGYFLFAGWVLMTVATFALMIWCFNVASQATSWIQYISIGMFLSIIIVQFGLIPTLLLVHGGRRRDRVAGVAVATIGMVGAWFLISSFQSDLVDIWEEVMESVYVLPPAIVICLLPMFLMKLSGRWKLVPPGGELRAGDPSISSILAMTAIIAVGVTSLTKMNVQDFIGTESVIETTFLFLYYLALPGLTIGTMLAASCYCAMGQSRSVLKIAASFAATALLFSAIAPACLSALAVRMLENETVDPEFLGFMFIHSLGPLIVGTAFGLFTAYWLRLAGYQLCTRGGQTLQQTKPEETL